MRSDREAAVFVRRGDRYLVLLRSRDGVWNTAAGQVELGESFIDAAARELREETGLDAPTLVDLALPVTYAVPDGVRELYPSGTEHVTLHHFAAEAPPGWEPVLDHEHREYRWCSYDQALELLYWPEAKSALALVPLRLPRA